MGWLTRVGARYGPGPGHCPFCNAMSLAQPVLVPLEVVEDTGKPDTVQPYAKPHLKFICRRCGYTEIHDHKPLAPPS